MRNLVLTALVVTGVFATSMPAQTRKAPRRSESGAGDTVIPRTPRNSPVPQGWVNTQTTKSDWEEINFEFNSSILTDGFPTLLWLADFLRSNPDYRVMITGHTDFIGGVPYNERLALARANVVREFLMKYGASGGQITANGEGKRNPEVDNSTREHRWVNRRVAITVTDANGKKMSLEDLIASKYKNQAPAAAAAQGPSCCDEILKRLDELASLVKGLKDGEQAAHDDLKKQIDDVRQQVSGLPNKESVSEIARKEGDVTAEKAADQAFKKGVTNNKKFSLLGLNIGPTFGAGRTGSFTFSGRGQFFSPFGNGQLPGALGTHAVQAQGEYLYYPGRQEGQFDIGLVNRWDRLQMGMFSSFKYASFRQFQSGGLLGQAALAFDYLFNRGRIGVFGTKGFKDNAVVNRATLAPGTFLETYLKIVNQVGASGQVGLFGKTYLEGNFGYLESHMPGSSGRPGGMVRFVDPLSDHFALTVEAGLNETYLATKNSGRVVVGFEFGNWLRPGQFFESTQPVPMEIPRVRYELLTRRVGNSPPVADAGPDQIGVPPGVKTLDGSASYDLDGDPLTFQWEQISGPMVGISGTSTAKATFTADSGQTYVFRLTVRDPAGMQSTARVTVTTIRTDVHIIKFIAQPNVIQSGQSSTLIWQTENADTVEISGIGKVSPSGTSTVSPTQTTTYQLTARRGSNQQNETVTVTVERAELQIVNFMATPTNIAPGEVSTLSWTTRNAKTVSISGVGTVSANGTTSVSPKQTTTYTMTATANDGTQVSSAVTVTVGSGGLPRILNFTATPTEVASGGQATLVWNVENATKVNISGIGDVQPSGSTPVNPTATTTYTLTATNGQGSITATAVVSVGAQVKIINFTVNPPSVAPGQPVTLTWSTQNATDAVITGVGSVPVNGSIQVKPTANTIYTLIAYGRLSQVSADVLANVNGSNNPVCSITPDQVTGNNTEVLDASRSFSPLGLPLTYALSLVSGTAPATITGGNTATPTVHMPTNGEYLFQLTVTDSQGGSCTTYTHIKFVDP